MKPRFDPQTGPPATGSSHANDEGGDPPCWAHLSEDADCDSVGAGRATITTALCRLLDIEHPILLAPMGDVAGGKLAAAVSGAGGLGMIGAGYAYHGWLERELDAAGEARVGVGFITFALDSRPDSLSLALKRRPPAIQLSFGDPRPYSEQIHAAGALLICQIQTVKEAVTAVAAGADVIVAQGQDAGGHGRPTRGTIGLVPSVVDEVAPVPVVAAGGIADGRGLAAALMLGASGVALGTRLYATTEAITDDAARAMLRAAGGDDTVRTSVFDVIRGPAWPPGHDGRAIRNRTVERWHRDPDELLAKRSEASAEYLAAAEDDYSVRPLWAGEGLDLIRSISEAEWIIREVVDQAARSLSRGSDLLNHAADLPNPAPTTIVEP